MFKIEGLVLTNTVIYCTGKTTDKLSKQKKLLPDENIMNNPKSKLYHTDYFVYTVVLDFIMAANSATKKNSFPSSSSDTTWAIPGTELFTKNIKMLNTSIELKSYSTFIV